MLPLAALLVAALAWDTSASPMEGQAVSLGRRSRVTATVTFDRSKAEAGGMIFAARRLAYADAKAARLSEALILGDAGLASNGALAARRYRLAAVAFPRARWGGDWISVDEPVYGPARRGAAGSYRVVKALSPRQLREGDVATLDAEDATVRLYDPDEQALRLSAADAARGFEGLRDVPALGRWIETASEPARAGAFLLEELAELAARGGVSDEQYRKARAAVERAAPAARFDDSGVLARGRLRVSAAERDTRSGGAATLSEAAASAGAVLPPRVPLGADVFRRFMAEGGLEARLGDILSDPSLGLRRKAERAQGAVLSAPLSPGSELGREILGRIPGEGEGEWAVLGGDGSAPGVLEQVKQAWAALWSVAALGPRLRTGRSLADDEVALVLQKAVPCGVSGRAFSRDPGSLSPSRLLIAASVPGASVPDQYVVDRRGRQLMGAVLGAPDRRRALSHDELRRVARLAAAVEAHLGRAAEIGFCVAGKDALYLLDARPLVEPDGR